MEEAIEWLLHVQGWVLVLYSNQGARMNGWAVMGEGSGGGGRVEAIECLHTSYSLRSIMLDVSIQLLNSAYSSLAPQTWKATLYINKSYSSKRWCQ